MVRKPLVSWQYGEFNFHLVVDGETIWNYTDIDESAMIRALCDHFGFEFEEVDLDDGDDFE